MANNRGRQKQLAKQRKKRAHVAAQARATTQSNRSLRSEAALLRLASTEPLAFGPAFMSSSWRDDDEDMPQLVSVVMTRVLPNGDLFPAMLLVDRTCFGVKNAMTMPPCSRAALEAHLASFEEMLGDFEETTVHEAQSVIYNAIAYARTLGFEPHPDFPEPVIGECPEVLADTPLSRPSRPIFIAGPDDDEVEVHAKLARATAP